MSDRNSQIAPDIKYDRRSGSFVKQDTPSVEKTWMQRNLTNLILILMGLVGVGLIAYPSFADWWNSFHQSRAVASYMEAVSNMDKEMYEQMLNEADAYNSELAASGTKYSFTEAEKKKYEKVLNVNDTGIMGYIDIPKIDIELPIYHGTSEEVLQVAVGHLEGTSLPVGGTGSHCVISGHRGLPSARLFTDIDKLAEGDTFTLTVLNRTATYEVDQIRIVEPTDLSEIQIQNGKDYCTLVTCTPYGINTHRLLVRGHRVSNAQGDAMIIADALQIQSIFIAPFIAVPILILLLMWMLASTGRNKKLKALLSRTRDEYGVVDDDPDLFK